MPADCSAGRNLRPLFHVAVCVICYEVLIDFCSTLQERAWTTAVFSCFCATIRGKKTLAETRLLPISEIKRLNIV